MEDDILPTSTVITTVLTSFMTTSVMAEVMIDGAVVVKEGDEIRISFPDLPPNINIEYTWGCRDHVLKVKFMEFEGVISRSFFIDAWEMNPALELFCCLIDAAKQAIEENTTYHVYVVLMKKTLFWKRRVFIYVQKEEDEFEKDYTFVVKIRAR